MTSGFGALHEGINICVLIFFLPSFETTFTQQKERANIAAEVSIPTEPRRHSDRRFDKERDGLDGVCRGRAWGCFLASLLTDSFCLKVLCSRQLIRTKICIELAKFVNRLLPFSSLTDPPPPRHSPTTHQPHTAEHSGVVLDDLAEHCRCVYMKINHFN